MLIWDTFAVDKVVDVSARVLLRLSPHASLYPSHFPYLFLKQMWYLLWKHKMLKMGTREQCQVSNQTSFIQGDLALEVEKTVPLRFSYKQSCQRSGSRDSENGASSIWKTVPLRFLREQSCWESSSRDSESGVSSIFEKVIMLGVWLSRFGGRCLFDFGASNLVGSVFSNVSKGWARLLVYLATEHRG
ncbi:hypothetical protein TB1_019250 [Malus domestica]